MNSLASTLAIRPILLACAAASVLFFSNVSTVRADTKQEGLLQSFLAWDVWQLDLSWRAHGTVEERAFSNEYAIKASARFLLSNHGLGSDEFAKTWEDSKLLSKSVDYSTHVTAKDRNKRERMARSTTESTPEVDALLGAGGGAFLMISGDYLGKEKPYFKISGGMSFPIKRTCTGCEPEIGMAQLDTSVNDDNFIKGPLEMGSGNAIRGTLIVPMSLEDISPKVNVQLDYALTPIQRHTERIKPNGKLRGK